MYDQSINFGGCTCRKFDTTGIPCRHLFLVLSSLEISKIPKEFIMKRWHKHATSWSPENFYSFGKDDKTALICELWYEFRSIADLASHDKNKLEKLIESVKTMKEEYIQIHGPHNGASKSDFFKTVLGMDKPAEVLIKTPNISKNKGRGKRLKSAREIAITNPKKRRLCSNCGLKEFHNARTCPVKKKGPLQKDHDQNDMDGVTTDQATD